jgi:hypothetical protein
MIFSGLFRKGRIEMIVRRFSWKIVMVESWFVGPKLSSTQLIKQPSEQPSFHCLSKEETSTELTFKSTDDSQPDLKV